MIRADWRALANRLGLPNAAPPRARDQKRSLADECWVFSMAWARSRGTALELAAQRPRDAEDRLFPNPHGLVAGGTDNLGMLLADGAEGLPASLRKQAAMDRRLKVALRSPANRVVCPPEELPRLRGALLRPDCPETLRHSHLIAFTRGEGLGSQAIPASRTGSIRGLTLGLLAHELPAPQLFKSNC